MEEQETAVNQNRVPSESGFKASESDRYEITVLIGPCEPQDAEWFQERIAHYVYDETTLGHPFGAVVALHHFREEERQIDSDGAPKDGSPAPLAPEREEA